MVLYIENKTERSGRNLHRLSDASGIYNGNKSICLSIEDIFQHYCFQTFNFRVCWDEPHGRFLDSCSTSN